jgi:hypothetical protein
MRGKNMKTCQNAQLWSQFCIKRVCRRDGCQFFFLYQPQTSQGLQNASHHSNFISALLVPTRTPEVNRVVQMWNGFGNCQIWRRKWKSTPFMAIVWVLSCHHLHFLELIFDHPHKWEDVKDSKLASCLLQCAPACCVPLDNTVLGRTISC